MDIFEKISESSAMITFRRKNDENRTHRIFVLVHKKSNRLEIQGEQFILQKDWKEFANAPSDLKYSSKYGHWQKIIPELTYEEVMEITAIASVYINKDFVY